MEQNFFLLLSINIKLSTSNWIIIFLSELKSIAIYTKKKYNQSILIVSNINLVIANVIELKFLTHVLWLQATIYQEQSWFVSETIGRTWERIQFAIVSPALSKKANLFSYPAILLCQELSFPCIWRQIHRHQSQSNSLCARLSCILIRCIPQNLLEMGKKC